MSMIDVSAKILVTQTLPEAELNGVMLHEEGMGECAAAVVREGRR